MRFIQFYVQLYFYEHFQYKDRVKKFIDTWYIYIIDENINLVWFSLTEKKLVKDEN